MTERVEASVLEHVVQGTVRFSDGSLVEIEGCSRVEFTKK
jgi:hypothetical protein